MNEQEREPKDLNSFFEQASEPFLWEAEQILKRLQERILRETREFWRRMGGKDQYFDIQMRYRDLTRFLDEFPGEEVNLPESLRPFFEGFLLQEKNTFRVFIEDTTRYHTGPTRYPTSPLWEIGLRSEEIGYYARLEKSGKVQIGAWVGLLWWEKDPLLNLPLLERPERLKQRQEQEDNLKKECLERLQDLGIPPFSKKQVFSETARFIAQSGLVKKIIEEINQTTKTQTEHKEEIKNGLEMVLPLVQKEFAEKYFLEASDEGTESVVAISGKRLSQPLPVDVSEQELLPRDVGPEIKVRIKTIEANPEILKDGATICRLEKSSAGELKITGFPYFEDNPSVGTHNINRYFYQIKKSSSDEYRIGMPREPYLLESVLNGEGEVRSGNTLLGKDPNLQFRVIVGLELL